MPVFVQPWERDVAFHPSAFFFFLLCFIHHLPWCLSHCCRALMQQFVFPAQPQTNSTRNSIVTSPKGTVPSSALVLQLCVHLCLVCLVHSKYDACTCVSVLFGLKPVLSLTHTFLPELVVKLSFLRCHTSPNLSDWGISWCQCSSECSVIPPSPPTVLICFNHPLQARKNILSDQCNLIFHLCSASLTL